MQDDFYRAFEEKYYAPRETILEMRRQYLPIARALFDHFREGRACDIGCGRGEWLELMSEVGFASLGVDLNEAMLATCREHGLSVLKADGIEYLSTLEADSQAVVSAFHLIEHIPFEKLTALVREAFRVLRPGGVLILETPNPENIRVATSNFYLDPTHRRPIPAGLLSFLTEYQGFGNVQVALVQEDSDLAAQGKVSLMDVMTGVSPDYAVIAQKTEGADQNLVRRVASLFKGFSGLTLHTLAARYDGRQEERHFRTEALARERGERAEAQAALAREQAEDARRKGDAALEMAGDGRRKGDAALEQSARAEKQSNHAAETAHQASAASAAAEGRAAEAEELSRQARTSGTEAVRRALQAEEAVRRAEEHNAGLQDRLIEAENLAREVQAYVQMMDAHAHELHNQLAAMYDSFSWRITWPLRKLGSLLGFLARLPGRTASRMCRSLLLVPMRAILARPHLSMPIDGFLHRFPRLRKRLHRVGQEGSLVSATAESEAEPRQDMAQPHAAEGDEGLRAMPESARRVYDELVSEMQRAGKGKA